MKDSKENCPLCKEDLQGEQIPEKQQESYGATHFSKKIGIYDTRFDRTVRWVCPYCDGEWDR